MSSRDILVGANTGGFESLGGQLLVLVGDQVDTGGEVVHVGLLTTKIEDTNLRVGNTTVEPGLGVGLNVDSCQSNRSSKKYLIPQKSIAQSPAIFLCNRRHPSHGELVVGERGALWCTLPTTEMSIHHPHKSFSLL
jgi:hypothetical protein